MRCVTIDYDLSWDLTELRCRLHYFLPELWGALYQESDAVQTPPGSSVVQGQSTSPGSMEVERGRGAAVTCPASCHTLLVDWQGLRLLLPLPQQPPQNIESAVPAVRKYLEHI